MTKNDVINIKKKFETYYLETGKDKNKAIKKFRYEYRHLEKNREKYNQEFLINEKEEVSDLLNDVCGYKLDKQQCEIVVRNDQNTLVIAGAGSGKSLTIIGKIRYLIERKKVPQNRILCISFTNEATISLREKLKKHYGYDIHVTTFHKLAMDIIRKNEPEIKISSSNSLEYIIDEYLMNKDLIPFLAIYFGVKENMYENYIKNHPYVLISFKKLIQTFIKLYKSTYLDFSHYEKLFHSKLRFFKKKYIFLKIVYQIHQIYEQELKSSLEIDFDDMLHLSTNYVKQNKNIYQYDYIIIDEYQDTSYVRFLLIDAILEKTKAHLLVVGDDFQSIYRFTGCNLDIFLNFKNYFKDATILKIENTYRSPFELIQIAGKFVMKNKKQIRKKLKSSHNIQDTIQVAHYNNKKEIFKKLILKIYNESHSEIMILGRNNKDIMSVLDDDFQMEENKITYLKNRDIKLIYYTVHRAKGLEADNVIIINMEDRILGFPNQIEDDSILKYVLKDKIYYPFEEERRLFYVALTRTKNRVYLMVPNSRDSIFVKELKRNYKIKSIKKWN